MSVFKVIKAVIERQQKTLSEAFKRRVREDPSYFQDETPDATICKTFSAQTLAKLTEAKNNDWYEISLVDDSQGSINLIDLTAQLRTLGASFYNEGPFSQAIFNVHANKIMIPSKAIEEYPLDAQPQEKIPDRENDRMQYIVEHFNDFIYQNIISLTSEEAIKLCCDDKIRNSVLNYITTYINNADKIILRKNAQLLLLAIINKTSASVKTILFGVLDEPIFSINDLYDVLNEFNPQQQIVIIDTFNKIPSTKMEGFLCRFLLLFYKKTKNNLMTIHMLLIAEINGFSIEKDHMDKLLIQIPRLTPFNLLTTSDEFFALLKNDNELFQRALNALMMCYRNFSNEQYQQLKNIVANNNFGFSIFADSAGCILLRNRLNNFIQLRPQLTHKDKVALYYMMQPYMDDELRCKNKLKMQRPLATNLRVFYDNLCRDVINTGAIMLYEKVDSISLQQIKTLFNQNDNFHTNHVARIIELSRLSNANVVNTQTKTDALDSAEKLRNQAQTKL